MGKLLFGLQDTVTCITDIPQSTPDGEELCLAHKTTGYFLGAGVYFRDSGYVLGIRHDAKRYIEVSPEALREMQTEGVLPSPLPAYSIPLHEYAFGYSLWLILGAVIAWSAIDRWVKRRSRTRDEATPVSLGPPALRTEADRFVDAQVRPLLRPGEQVQHQAYTLSGEPGGTVFGAAKSAAAPAYFSVLTDQRLIFIETRQGAFGPLLENGGVEEIERTAVTEAFRAERAIVVHARGPVARMMWVQRTGKLSNQDTFLRDVHRLLVVPAAQAESAATAA